MTQIYKLLKESSGVSNAQGRPELLSLTRAVNSLIYTDLVAVQPSTQPVSALYGMRYLNMDNNMTFTTPATYGGAVGSRKDIETLNVSKEYKAGDLFKHNDTVYQVIQDGAIGSDKEEQEALFRAIILNKIRLNSDAASTEHFSDIRTEIAESRFQLDKWQSDIKTRKLKTKFTQELLQDLEANQMYADSTISDLLSTTISEEINKDIIQKLITISTRYNVSGLTNEGVISLVGVQDAPSQSRELYRYVCEMSAHLLKNTSFRGTYVLASSRVVGILAASGWMSKSDNPLSDGILRCGLEVYADTTTPFDYMLVGCKHKIGDMESVGSMFYAPFIEPDGVGAYKVIDNNFDHNVSMISRYSLSVNPYTTTAKGGRIVKGDDWNALAGRSEMSLMVGIELPKISTV